MLFLSVMLLSLWQRLKIEKWPSKHGWDNTDNIRETQKQEGGAEGISSGEEGGRGRGSGGIPETVQDHWPQWLISDACADQLTDPAPGR